MAETRRTRAYLTSTNFANNTTGDITAQDVREFVESSMGAYATIYNKGGDTTPNTQAVANATTVTLDWDGGSTGGDGAEDTDASTYGANADAANDYIRVYDSGTYLVNFGMSFSQSINSSVVWTISIATNTDSAGATLSNFKIQRALANNSDVASVHINGIITTTHTTNTDFLIRMSHDNGSSNTQTLNYAQLSVVRVG